MSELPRRVNQWPVRSAEERFWEKVDKNGPNGCWQWTGAPSKHGRGYGMFQMGKTNRYAHRCALAFLGYLLLPGLEVDHVCNNTMCVNPEHLEQVTHRENLRRWAARITHCPQGHEYTEENTVWSKDRVERKCRLCKNEATRRYRRTQSDRASSISS
jgi:hypothetical protein